MLFVIIAQERDQLADFEDEVKKEAERNERTKFMRIFPFKTNPTFDSLQADPHREPSAAMWDFDQMMRHREEEENKAFATVGSLRDLCADSRKDRDEIFDIASQAFYEVSELEKRLNLVLGPIPYLQDD